MRVAALLLCLPLLAFTVAIRVRAEEVSSPEVSPAVITNQLAFSAEVREVGGRGFLTRRCAYVRIGSARFSFLVPEGARVSTATEDRINVIKNDYSCVISFRAATGDCATLNPEQLRQALIGRFYDLRFAGERQVTAADYTGTAFDFFHESDGLKRKTRMAFVPSAAGILEFKMTTALDRFEANQDMLNEVLGSFRAAKPNGELEVVRLPIDS